MLRFSLTMLALLVFLGVYGSRTASAHPRFKGSFRPPLQAYPNPPTMDPDTEDCDNATNGATANGDGDGDGTINWNDTDCQEQMPRVQLGWRSPLGVVEGIAGNSPPRVAPGGLASNSEFGRSGLPFGELLLNTTGVGGRKLGYVRTHGDNVYSTVQLGIVLLPGVDWSGVAAVRIQGADAATNAGASYYASVGLNGDPISINMQNSDGTSTVLASTATWDDGSAVNIAAFDAAAVTDSGDGNPCFRVALSASGSTLDLSVGQVDCTATYFLLDEASKTATLQAVDNTLAEGYVGLRADNDGGVASADPPDDEESSTLHDPSVLFVSVNDPSLEKAVGTPKIIYNDSTGSDDLRMGIDYNMVPNDMAVDGTGINGGNQIGGGMPHRFGNTSSHAHINYLTSLGITVDIMNSDVFEDLAGPPFEALVNDRYDMLLENSSNSPLRDDDAGTSGQRLTIPVMTSEHIDGRNDRPGLGLYAGNSTNERRSHYSCGDEPGFEGATRGITKMRVTPAAFGGNPDHPITQGLADENGDIVAYDASEIKNNLPYDLTGVESLNGSYLIDLGERLLLRGEGLGVGQTQVGGWPIAPSATSITSHVNPCTDEANFQLDGDGNLIGGSGYQAIIAADVGPRLEYTDPANQLFDPNEFSARAIFYPISDKYWAFAAKGYRDLTKRMVLWNLGYIGVSGGDEPVGRDNLFIRGDSNGDGTVDISDASNTLGWLFLGGAEPGCLNSADANDDEAVDISDASFGLSFLFLGGPAPVGGSAFSKCGIDFTPAPGEGTPQSCVSYNACPN